MLIWCLRAWAGLSSPSLAAWPEAVAFLTVRSVSGVRPVCSVISVLWMQSCHVTPRICLWNFMWKDSSLLVSVAYVKVCVKVLKVNVDTRHILWLVSCLCMSYRISDGFLHCTFAALEHLISDQEDLVECCLTLLLQVVYGIPELWVLLKCSFFGFMLLDMYWSLLQFIVTVFFITGRVLLLSFSALTLLVGWQEGHLACKKTEWWPLVGCWHSYLFGRGADNAYDPADATATHCHTTRMIVSRAVKVAVWWGSCRVR